MSTDNYQQQQHSGTCFIFLHMHNCCMRFDDYYITKITKISIAFY